MYFGRHDSAGQGDEINGIESSPLILFIPLIPSAFWRYGSECRFWMVQGRRRDERDQQDSRPRMLILSIPFILSCLPPAMKAEWFS